MNLLGVASIRGWSSSKLASKNSGLQFGIHSKEIPRLFQSTFGRGPKSTTWQLTIAKKVLSGINNNNFQFARKFHVLSAFPEERLGQQSNFIDINLPDIHEAKDAIKKSNEKKIL
jgi:hypothetical protein